jgi:hypothetical protein
MNNVTTQENMMDWEEGTAKDAKGAKKEAKLLFKDESYKIIGACSVFAYFAHFVVKTLWVND